MIITPPIVGVPFFCCSPASPRSRTVSSPNLLLITLISRLPNTSVITSDNSIASNTRKEIKPRIPLPGKLISFSLNHSNKWYSIVGLVFWPPKPPCFRREVKEGLWFFVQIIFTDDHFINDYRPSNSIYLLLRRTLPLPVHYSASDLTFQTSSSLLLY